MYRRILISLLAIAACIVPLHTGSAQRATPTANDLPGIETAYGRLYSDTGTTTPASQSTSRSGTDVVSLGIFTFANEQQAQDMFANETGPAITAAERRDPGVHLAQLPALGDEAVQFTSLQHSPNSTALVVRDGVVVISIVTLTPDLDRGEVLAAGIAEHVVSTSENGQQIEFHADGSSTGGVFSRLPSAGDSALGPMVPVKDSDFLALPATPVATPTANRSSTRLS